MQQSKMPSEIITLPSEGKYYTKDNKLSAGTIELYLPTAKHEDILTSKTLLNKGLAIDTFLSSLIVDKDINYDDMLLSDKNGLIIAARTLLYGPQYEYLAECPACGEKTKLTADISNFDTVEFEKLEPISDENPNEFAFTLPKSGKDIKFKLLTVGDDKMIAKELKSSKKMNNRDAGMSTRLSFVITEFNGETNRYKIIKMIDNELLSLDSLALRTKITDVSPGVDSLVNFECSNCDHEGEIMMPIGVDFFWPSTK